MNPNLADLLDRLGEAAHQLVAARAEQLFREAYDEAVAEGRDLVKERLLRAMVEQSTAWLAQQAAEGSAPLVPEALASATNDGSPRSTPTTPDDALDGTLEWAGEEPTLWVQEDAPEAPSTFTFEEPIMPESAAPSAASEEPAPARKETPADETPADKASQPETQTTEAASSSDEASSEAELLQELARIREQIDRNEHLLGQLQPFLKQLQ